MQWCCAAGEWGQPHQLDLARWPYIQPRHLVRSLCSAASGLMPHPFQASPTLRRLSGFTLESSKVCPSQFMCALPGQCSAGCHAQKTLAQLRSVLTCTLNHADTACVTEVESCLKVPWTQDGLANAWRTPTLRRPAICERPQGINEVFIEDYENHPCRFLNKSW